jgi:hypothetical protein
MLVYNTLISPITSGNRIMIRVSNKRYVRGCKEE